MTYKEDKIIQTSKSMKSHLIKNKRKTYKMALNSFFRSIIVKTIRTVHKLLVKTFSMIEIFSQSI